MLLFLNRSENLECTKVSFLSAIPFDSKIHYKPLKLSNKSLGSGQAHSTKDKRICLVCTCRNVPLVAYTTTR